MVDEVQQPQADVLRMLFVGLLGQPRFRGCGGYSGGESGTTGFFFSSSSFIFFFFLVLLCSVVL